MYTVCTKSGTSHCFDHHNHIGEIRRVSFSSLTSIWRTFCSDKCWVTLDMDRENKFTFSCKQSYGCTILTKIRDVLKNCSKTFEYQIPCTYVRQHSRCHMQADGDRKVTSTHAQLPTVTVPYRFLPKHRSYTNAVNGAMSPMVKKTYTGLILDLSDNDLQPQHKTACELCITFLWAKRTQLECSCSEAIS